MPNTDKPLDGRVALITGAVRRSGRATALALAEDGAAIVINARASKDEADSVAAEVEAAGGRAIVHLADVTDEAAVETMFARIDTEFGRLDILVNNAADRQQVPFVEMTYDQWRHITSIIMDGAFLCCRAALRRMTDAGWGRVINLGGIGNHMGFIGRAHVNAGKAGLEGLTRGLAIEFADRGITVNCVSPGKIGGPRAKSAGETAPNSKGTVPPVGHEGVPNDIGRTIRFLCQPDADFITGQTIHVNGGQFLT
jgi:3-oxoacyl-[acyl-carrier protein] reductase